MTSGTAIDSDGERTHGASPGAGCPTHSSKLNVANVSFETMRADARKTMHSARRTVVTWTGIQERFKTSVDRSRTAARLPSLRDNAAWLLGNASLVGSISPVRSEGE